VSDRPRSIAGASEFWRAHRIALLFSLLAAWVIGISWAHEWLAPAHRSLAKGAGELLRIGALPVT